MASLPSSSNRERRPPQIIMRRARPDDIKPGQTSRWVIRYRLMGAQLPGSCATRLVAGQGQAIPARASHSMNESMSSDLLAARHQAVFAVSDRLTLTRQTSWEDAREPRGSVWHSDLIRPLEQNPEPFVYQCGYP